MDENVNINNTPVNPVQPQAVDYQQLNSSNSPRKPISKILIIVFVTLAALLIVVVLFILRSILSPQSTNEIEPAEPQSQNEIFVKETLVEPVLSTRTLSSEYTISIENAEEVEEYIEKSGILDKKYNELGEESLPLKRVVIVLSEEVQPHEEVFNKQGEKVSTIGLIFISDRLELFIHPDPAYATDNEKIGEAMNITLAYVLESLAKTTINQGELPATQPIFRIEE